MLVCTYREVGGNGRSSCGQAAELEARRDDMRVRAPIGERTSECKRGRSWPGDEVAKARTQSRLCPTNAC